MVVVVVIVDEPFGDLVKDVWMVGRAPVLCVL